MFLTFALLCGAIAAVWLPAADAPGRTHTPTTWQILLFAAILTGLFQSVLTPVALPSLLAIWICVWGSLRPGTAWRSAALVVMAVLLALAFSAHLLPGFNNPQVATDLKLSADSAAITQRANFDKGAAGLIFLAYFCRRARTVQEFARALGTGLVFGLASAVVVIGIVAATGVVAFDPKLPVFAWRWIPINLFLTCVLEEAFFRGLLQERLMLWAKGKRRWRWVPVALPSLMFGLVHAGGGLQLVAAASLAGVGYGLAYARTRTIEAAIIAHFTLNAVHFFGFTYPYAVR